MTYSTGELAKVCDVSIRTIQYYDQKDVLKPTQIIQGRRYYSEADKVKLDSILLLKSMGISLEEIKKILHESKDTAKLKMLIQKKEDELNMTLKKTEDQLARLKKLNEIVSEDSEKPMTHMENFETISKGMDEMKRMRKMIFISAGIMGAFQFSALVTALVKRKISPILYLLPFRLLYAAGITTYYYRKVSYVCPHCQTIFKPKFSQMFFANHTLKTRQLTCPHCGETHYCIEVLDEQ